MKSNGKGFKTRRAMPLAALAFGLAATQPAWGAYTIGDGDTYFKIGGLLQSWTTANMAPETSLDSEFYLRRMRLMFSGQVNSKLNFFIETDNPNFGKDGNWTGNTFIQDAYLEYNLDKRFQVDAGMLLMPFSHHGMQGATSLLGLDYHSPLFKYPMGSNKVWRDVGFMARGLVADEQLEYRLAIANGVTGNSALTTIPSTDGSVSWQQVTDPRNPQHWPRVVARLTMNLLDPEGGPGVGGMFYDGIYFKNTEEGLVSTKSVLSLGGAIDWQKDVNAVWSDSPNSGERTVAEYSDYVAVAGDIFWDVPVGQKKIMSINGQVNFHYFDHGDQTDGNSYYATAGGAEAASMFTGYGVLTEAGFRYNRIQPLVMFDFYDAFKAEGDAGDYMGVFGGFNYWFYTHSASLKLQAGKDAASRGDWKTAARMQLQLLF